MIKRFVNDIKKYYSYAVYSAKAELKAEVAGSYLNWVWWILEPVCLMLIYAFIFGVVFEAREEYFTAFIYIGLTVWTFFNQNLKNSVKIVKKNKSVVSKVYLPKFILVESKMFVNAFKMLISFAIVVALMIGYRVHLTWNVIYVIPLMLCLVLVSFGLMCIVCHFGVFVEDLSNVINIVLRLIFYMTGIMFSIDHRIGPKHPVLATFLGKFNPMAYIISSLRSCLLYGETPARKIMLAWMCVGLLLTVIGVRLIYKNENSYVKVI
jgi:ABC-type polysaccharide/polyol phosphate export permease